MSLTDVMVLPNELLEMAVEITIHDNENANAKAEIRTNAARIRQELKAHAARH